ncbi:MAG TPA: thioredoxin-dependent thiol peroxidase [Candidatus Woesebacteria bacterium]|nr:thioredoxin-dependent thiol peroxidase [Candidatus Woesebacteria bacterium]
MAIQIGNQAPEFTLPDQLGVLHNLTQYRGRWIVLYFYPKDDTPGCTKEACSFRDNFESLKEKGIVVLGVSKDTQASHKKFSEKYNLNFTLLSDESTEMIKRYEAFGEKKFMGKTFQGILRTTYVIDPQGIVRKVYENVKPQDHAQEILRDIVSLQQENNI